MSAENIGVREPVDRWLSDEEAKAYGVFPLEDERISSRTFLFDSYRPFAKQQQFHESGAKYRLFGGAAGPGKSKALLIEAIMQANDHGGVNTLLLRRTFSELESTLLHYFRRDIPREIYRSYNEAKRIVTWHNGSTTRFGYCRTESDVYQYQGAEFVFIGVDELTLFTLRQWQFLTSRNRTPVPFARPCMAGATNPGNVGHSWVKALWIDKTPAPGMEHAEEYDPRDYEFISARVSDNPIYAENEEYLRTLRALPEAMRRAFLDGDWDIFAGQYFDNFDREKHVRRAEEIGIQKYWPRHISIDWGFEHPAAVYWHASDGKRVVTYREFVRNRLAPRELAKEIAARSVESDGEEEAIREIHLSPDAFAHRTDESSIAQQMGDVFNEAGLPRPQPADDDRVGGWMLMYQMLGEGEWLIADNCAELIRTLPTLTRDPARVEDIEKCAGDDAADAARYGLKTRRNPLQMPAEVRVAERVTSDDPTIRAIQARKAMLETSRANAPVFRSGRGARH